jgi:deazaflavin-dependent oxidoreductase (nitroreductase family)
MVMQVITVVGVVVLVLVALLGAFVLGMRAKSPLALAVVRAMSRVFNPIQMRSAGRPGAFASIIRHRGRTSGRSYATPVGAVRSADGFVITLPYGTAAHWVRNVLAAGEATLLNEGETFLVDMPEVVATASVKAVFSSADQRVNRIFGVDQCLHLRRVNEAEPAPALALAG